MLGSGGALLRLWGSKGFHIRGLELSRVVTERRQVFGYRHTAVGNSNAWGATYKLESACDLRRSAGKSPGPRPRSKALEQGGFRDNEGKERVVRNLGG